jgi:hypothetical protein
MDACARGYQCRRCSQTVAGPLAYLLRLAEERRCGACVAVAGAATGWSEPKGEAQRLAFVHFSFLFSYLSRGLCERSGAGCYLHCSSFQNCSGVCHEFCGERQETMLYREIIFAFCDLHTIVRFFSAHSPCSGID